MLKIGSTGPLVAELQRKLNEKLATSMATKLVVDGNFGNATKNAVILFQQKNGLTADGIVGPATASKLGLNLSGTTQTSPAPGTPVVGVSPSTRPSPMPVVSGESFFSKHKKTIMLLGGTIAIMGIIGFMVKRSREQA